MQGMGGGWGLGEGGDWTGAWFCSLERLMRSLSLAFVCFSNGYCSRATSVA